MPTEAEINKYKQATKSMKKTFTPPPPEEFEAKDFDIKTSMFGKGRPQKRPLRNNLRREDLPRLPFTYLGETKRVPLVTYTNGHQDPEPRKHWTHTIFIDDPLDYQNISELNDREPGATVRVVTRFEWDRGNEE